MNIIFCPHCGKEINDIPLALNQNVAAGYAVTILPVNATAANPLPAVTWHNFGGK